MDEELRGRMDGLVEGTTHACTLLGLGEGVAAPRPFFFLLGFCLFSCCSRDSSISLSF